MKKDTLDEVNRLLTDHCQDCKVRQIIREEHGDKNTQNYCLDICKVGRSLQQLGRELEGTARTRSGYGLDKQTYINLSKQGYTDVKIAELYGIGTSTLGRRKKNWDVKKQPHVWTKEKYETKRSMGYTDKEISLAWSISFKKLNEIKRRWGP